MNQEFSKTVTNLPAAAQRWIERAIPEKQVTPTSVTLVQEGELEVRGRWMSFTAKGIYDGPPLAFNWQAKLRMMPGIWIAAEDGHSAGIGWGGAKMWGLISMGRRTDPEVLKTQVVRNLAEIPWIPSLALADSNLEWSDEGNRAFEVSSVISAGEIMVRFDVDDNGHIIRAFSPARPYDIPHGYAESPWSVEYDDYQEFGPVTIPGKAVATYHKEDGDWEYFRAKVIEVDFS